jgi:ubiquinone/menaquinone biosynthesis C-methylase UbiE
MCRRFALTRFWKSIAVLALMGVMSASADDRPAGPRVYKGRVIAPVMTAEGGGAEWLERTDRDATEQPDKVIEALKIPRDATVADVGAGTGYFSLRIAKRLGPEGRVLATDVQPEMIRQLTANAKKAGLRNVERILATPADAKLPAGKVDLALMVDVYHELQDPERTMAQIHRALKPNGRLVLVEYRAEDPEVPIKPEHKTLLRQMRYEIEPMGFRLKEVFEFLPHQHIEVFVKDEVKGEDPLVDAEDFPTIRRPGWAGADDDELYEKAGFARLFSGRDLDGWDGDSKVWRVRNDAIVGTAGRAAASDAVLRSRAAFGDFELDLLWRLSSSDASAAVGIGGESGFAVRLDDGVPYAAGYPEVIAARRTGEVTIGDDAEPLRAATDTAKAVVLPGEWNRLTIRRSGDHVSIAINGVETTAFTKPGRTEPSPVHLRPVGGAVEFRDVWIKRLEQGRVP